MNRFNFRVIKRFWSLAKLYWLGNEKKGALSLLALLFVLLVAYTQLSVLLNQQQGDIISSLSVKEVDRFWQTIRTFFVILVIYVPLFAGFRYVQGILGNFWRKWLTSQFLNRYFSQRAFYELGNLNKDIDNPDQRIAEDVKGFTVDSLSFLLSLVSSVFQVIAFSFALWQISQFLVYILLIYSSDLGSADAVIGQPAVVRNRPGDGLGYGIGLQTRTPIGLVRTEFALNDEGDAEFIFQVGDRF
ncbi:MAG: SbmA/BacA-like family transporter [Cyanobacteria bacterium J06648_1]